jgi:DNA modification methylase
VKTASKRGRGREGEIWIEWRALSEIKYAKRNPKRHEVAGIAASIVRRGFVAPAIEDARTGRLVAGHGRHEALVMLKAEGRDPPKRIRVRSDGEWEMPVLCGVQFATEADAEEYLVADNRWVELGGWDDSILRPMLEDIQKRGQEAVLSVGYPEVAIQRLIAQAEKERTGENDPDYVPPAAAKVVARPGDVWELGQHRLMCGDATDEAQVRALLGDARPALFSTDPPYGIDYVASKVGVFDRVRFADIENDDLSGDDLKAFLLRVWSAAAWSFGEGLPVYWWAPATSSLPYFPLALGEAGCVVHRQIAWVKTRMVLTRSGMYHPKHENCFFGWVQGKEPVWYGPKDQTSVWEVARDPGAAEHPTQKPVELFRIPMRNHTRQGEVCYEPFSGSGSQIIAGEQMQRRVFALELAPRYVDVAIRRWEAFTGKRAVRAQRGRANRKSA